LLSVLADLLAAGFAVGCLSIFVLVCADALETGDAGNEFETAVRLAKGFSDLSVGDRGKIPGWLLLQEMSLSQRGLLFRLEVFGGGGETLLTFGRSPLPGCVTVRLPCVYLENNFPRASQVVCHVWRDLG
jgi:hypothetical protein